MTAAGAKTSADSSAKSPRHPKPPGWQACLTAAGARDGGGVRAARGSVPFRTRPHRLADGGQVAPAFGEAAFAFERRAAAMPVHQIHRLARAVGGVARGQAAAGPLLERRLFAGSERVPQLGDHRAAVGAAGVEDRIGPPDSVLHLRAVAEQPSRAAVRLLAPGQIDQRIDASPRDAGDDGAILATRSLGSQENTKHRRGCPAPSYLSMAGICFRRRVRELWTANLAGFSSDRPTNGEVLKGVQPSDIPIEQPTKV